MSIVKESSSLRKAIHKRLKELYPSNSKIGFKQSPIIKDASERKFTIAPSALSRYINGDDKNGLSEAQIIWLSCRYGIPFQLIIGEVSIVGDESNSYRVTLSIPKFDEKKALEKLKLIFG